MDTAPVYPSTCVERFLRYVTYDTRSDETSTTTPSTPSQLVLQRVLVDELHALGLADAALDECGYVYATLPATTTRSGVPVVGFIAHVDTSPEVSGANVKPIVHAGYDGRDLVLPDDPTVVLRMREIPYLREQMGHDIITASGTTLLGADNKAGVAEIMGAIEYLVAHPEVEHGTIAIAFTPDEEIGRGANHFDVARFGAACAYTVDGGRRGELERESFSADTFVAEFQGFNCHPGFAKGVMVNAIKLAARFIDSLPADQSPETTGEYEGFVHPYVVQASVDKTTVRVLLRDFVTKELAIKAGWLEDLARKAVSGVAGASVACRVEPSYRNMREVLDQHPDVVERARRAVVAAGLEPIMQPIRGGTDGSRLSFMGLPTPNLFAGEQTFHSRLEWVSTYDMHKAVEVIVRLSREWATP
jgi:tripeptide aminopeptidase